MADVPGHRRVPAPPRHRSLLRRRRPSRATRHRPSRSARASCGLAAAASRRAHATTPCARGTGTRSCPPSTTTSSSSRPRRPALFDNLAACRSARSAPRPGDEDMMTRVAAKGAVHLPVDFTIRLDGFDRRAAPIRRSLHLRPPTATTCSSTTATSERSADRVAAGTMGRRDLVVRGRGPILGFFDEETVRDRGVDDGRAGRGEAGRPAAGPRLVRARGGLLDRQRRRARPDERHGRTPHCRGRLPRARAARLAAGGGHAPGPQPVRLRDGRGPRPDDHPRGRARRTGGRDDDRSPAWLVEGVAEHVSRAWASPRHGSLPTTAPSPLRAARCRWRRSGPTSTSDVRSCTTSPRPWSAATSRRRGGPRRSGP